MQIDEAGGYDQPAGLDFFPAPAAVHGDVRVKGRVARAVDYSAAPNDKIVTHGYPQLG